MTLTGSKSLKTDFSFCIPVYNAAPYLKQCIESIISQDLSDLKYEIICVDDCSIDNSLDILYSLSQIHPQIKVIKKEKNQGVSSARNTALKHSAGEFIWFVDPDDLLYPNSFKFLYTCIKNSNFNVIIANYMPVPEEFEIKDCTIKNESPSAKILSSHDNIGAKNINAKSKGYGMCSCCCCIFRSSFLKNNDIYFRENIHFQEDTAFYYEFTQKTDHILSSNSLCYLYRQRSSSAIHSRGDDRTKKYYNSLLNLFGVYQEYNIAQNKNKTQLSKKIHQTKEKIAQVLLMVGDTDYVKNQIKFLRQEKIYPYPLRWRVLSSNVSFAMRIALFLLPISPFFWLLHKIMKLKK